MAIAISVLPLLGSVSFKFKWQKIMQVEQSGEISKPITIGEIFFEQLGAIISGLQDRGLAAIAKKHGVPTAEVKRIMEGGARPPPKVYSPAEKRSFDQEIADLTKYQLEYAINREIESNVSLDCSVKFDTGFSTSTNDLQQLRSILSSEPGDLTFISFSIGQSYRGEGIRLTLSNSDRTCFFSINGERQEIDHLSQAISRVMKSSISDNPWLYNSTFHFFGGMALALLSIATVIVLGSRLSVQKQYIQPVEIIVLFLAIATGFATVTFFYKRMNKLFPRLQSEYGPEWRRRITQRRNYLLLLSAIVVPILINLFV